MNIGVTGEIDQNSIYTLALALAIVGALIILLVKIGR